MVGPAATPVPVPEATPASLGRANVQMQTRVLGPVVRKVKEEAAVRTQAADRNLSEMLTRLVQAATLRVDGNGRALGTILAKLVNAGRNRLSSVGGPLESLARRSAVLADPPGRQVYVPEAPPPSPVGARPGQFGPPPPPPGGSGTEVPLSRAGPGREPEPPGGGATCRDPDLPPQCLNPGLVPYLEYRDGVWRLRPVPIYSYHPNVFLQGPLHLTFVSRPGLGWTSFTEVPEQWPPNIVGIGMICYDMFGNECFINGVVPGGGGGSLILAPPVEVRPDRPPGEPPPPPPRPPGGQPPGGGPPPQIVPPPGCESPDPCRPPIFQLLGHDTYTAVLLPAAYWVQVCCLDRCNAEIWTYYADCPPPPRPGCRTIGPFTSLSQLDYPALVRYCLTEPPPVPTPGQQPPPGGGHPPEPPPPPPRPPLEETPTGERCPRPKPVRPELVLNEYVPVCRTYEEWAGEPLAALASYGTADEAWAGVEEDTAAEVDDYAWTSR